MKADVLIAGGGMVGATLACALGSAGLHVIVVDQRPVQPFDPGSEVGLRVSAISPGAVKMFHTLGVWALIKNRRYFPYQHMHVWDAAGQGEIHFDASEIGEPLLGTIVENDVIQDALSERCKSLKTISWRCPDSVELIQFDAQGVTMSLASGEVVNAPLLVGADGSASGVRKLAGIAFDRRYYNQCAVVANVGTEESHEYTARQRFLSTGPLAFLPLSEHYCSVVWSTTPQHAEKLVQMDEKTFCETLAKAFDFRIGNVTSTARRGAFDLRGGQAEVYVRPRLALIGDAAHTIHPLAGQGVNLGFMDAATLAEVIVDAQSKDIGSINVLRRYERTRKADNVMTMYTMETLKSLFGMRFPPVTWLRNIGLNMTHSLLPMKHQIMRAAMDLAGERPRLVRGLKL